MKDAYGHIEAIKMLEAWRNELSNKTANPQKQILNPMLMFIIKEIDRLTAEVEESIKTGDVQLKSVMFALQLQR